MAYPPREDFERFAESARASLMSQAVLLTGDVQDAQDLVQETLLRAWRAWPRIGGFDQPHAWTRRVLHNLAVNHWRRLRMRSAFTGRKQISVPEVDVCHLDVLSALQLLALRDRRVIVMHDVLGMTVAEVAAELRVPEGSVRTWLVRGRARIATALGIDTPTRRKEPR